MQTGQAAAIAGAVIVHRAPRSRPGHIDRLRQRDAPAAVLAPVGKAGAEGYFYYDYVYMECDWPPGAYWDLGQWLGNSCRIKQMADMVIPIHDGGYMEL